MKILVLNCGSSSLKFQLLEIEREERHKIASGIVERIGSVGAFWEIECGLEKIKEEYEIANHSVAVRLVLDLLCASRFGIVSSLSEIEAVGHRVVHGGEEFSESVLIDDAVIAAIEKNIDLAPLHNPANLAGILACRDSMPNVPQVAVFDTAFHESMPASSYLYAIPREYYEKHRIRRYGFHGTSHRYVSSEAAKFLEQNIDELKIITCHLGNGASMAAIQNGRVLDTSMGFTPLDGLVMGTRCGELDPSIISYLAEREKLSLSEINDILNKRSGLLGLFGSSNDMRDILQVAEAGDKNAQNTLDVYIYRIIKFIGAYTAALNGVDVIVFTAGVGERSVPIRQMVVDRLPWLGVELDEEKNKNAKGTTEISKPNSRVKILVVPTDEEYMIARDVYRIVGGGE